MVEQELLEILVCPESKQSLTVATPDLLDRVNAAIALGQVSTRSGERVVQTLSEALIREDGTLLYPVREDIPIMLIDEAIPLERLASGT